MDWPCWANLTHVFFFFTTLRDFPRVLRRWGWNRKTGSFSHKVLPMGVYAFHQQKNQNTHTHLLGTWHVRQSGRQKQKNGQTLCSYKGTQMWVLQKPWSFHIFLYGDPRVVPHKQLAMTEYHRDSSRAAWEDIPLPQLTKSNVKRSWMNLDMPKLVIKLVEWSMNSGFINPMSAWRQNGESETAIELAAWQFVFSIHRFRVVP